jgi:VanZ family protein
LFKYLEKNKKYFVYAPLVVYWLILFIGTSLPAQTVPQFGVKDKVEHFLAYMILTFLLSINFLIQDKIKIFRQKPFLFSFLLGSGYGVLDEVHQLIIPGRSCELLDLTADIIGSILGIILSYILFKIDYSRREIPE